METADDTLDLDERLAPPLDEGQRLFRIALAAAFLLHAALFIEVGRSAPRGIGDPSGRPDAIAVDLVTEADLRSRETVALPPAGGSPQADAASAPVPEPAPQTEAAEPAEAETKEALPKETPDATKQEPAALPDFAAALPDLTPLPQQAEPSPARDAEQEPAKPVEKPPPAARKEPARQARLDPAPRDPQDASPERSAAATRPPGITRSGENDEFGRAVIRALRQTMPPPRGIFGRVTVRLILTGNGDLAEVRLVAPSGTSLDQSVVFATRQTYFPLPPSNATLADRTFVITYVYR